MTDNTILWVILIGAVFWYGWRRGRGRRQGAASTATAQAQAGANMGHDHDPRSAQNWPKPASTPPDPQLGLPDLYIL